MKPSQQGIVPPISSSLPSSSSPLSLLRLSLCMLFPLIAPPSPYSPPHHHHHPLLFFLLSIFIMSPCTLTVFRFFPHPHCTSLALLVFPSLPSSSLLPSGCFLFVLSEGATSGSFQTSDRAWTEREREGKSESEIIGLIPPSSQRLSRYSITP